jgi:type I restriction enzyme S subunit
MNESHPHSYPLGWKEVPLSCLVKLNPDKLDESTDDECEIDYVDIGNVTLERGIISSERINFGNAPSRARRRVKKNDVIISTVRTYLKAVARIKEDVDSLIVSTGFAVLRPNEKINPQFLYRLVQSEQFVQEIEARSVGVSYPAINANQITKLRVRIPPIDTQTTIANFLESKTTQIDALIVKKLRLIELLKKKRQATISRAVTKGLNPDTPMKPSGVDWLGDVPLHWRILKLKYAVTFQRGHDLTADERVEGAVPVVTSSGVTSFHNRAKAKGPGIITGRYGTIGNFYLVSDDYWPHNTTLYSIDLHGNNPRFMVHMLTVLSDIFLLNSNKSAVPGVDRNDLHPVPVAVPEISEQIQIADFIESETLVIDRVMSKVELIIEKLKSLRATLINAAVKGQIDVSKYRGESTCL